jgi:hypothetical protein
LEPGHFRHDGDLLPVTADPGWDQTRRGLTFVAGNAREWTVSGHDEFAAVLRFAPIYFVPSRMTETNPSGRKGNHLLCIEHSDLATADRRLGLRVFRDLVTIR